MLTTFTFRTELPYNALVLFKTKSLNLLLSQQTYAFGDYPW